MRARLPLALTIAAAVAVAAACGGGDSPEPAEPTATATTSVPTATPFAVEPRPTIVSDAPPEAPRDVDVTYIVEPGDTLSEIAARFETTVAAIMAWNGLTDATLIFVGQELLISTTPAEETEGGSGGEEAESDASVYVVQPGDTAFAIAQRFDTTVEELAAANDTTVEQLAHLQPGDRLNLPRPR